MPLKFFGCMLLLMLMAGCSKVKENMKPAELEPFKPTVAFKQVWRTDAGAGQDARYQRLEPLLHEGMIYTADVDGGVRAFSAEKGKRQWRTRVDAAIGGGVGISGDLILVGTLAGEVVALDKTSGEIRWRSPISSEVVSSPQGNGDVVVAKAIDGRVFALNNSDGEERWTYDHPVPVLTLRSQASPVVVGATAYVGFDNGQIMAFNSGTGQLRWSARVGQPKGKTEIERLIDVDTTPVVAGPFLYGAGFHGRIVAIANGTGRVNWAQDVSTFHDIVESDGKLVVVDDESHIKVFDAASGTLVWESDKLHRRALSPAGVLNGAVVVTDFEGFIHALDLETGAFLGRSDIRAEQVYAQPITGDNVIYLLDSAGTLTAYEFKEAKADQAISTKAKRYKGALPTKRAGTKLQ